MMVTLTPSIVQALLGAALVCGAFVPGPCEFDPHRDFDCSLGELCDEKFACALDGYCKSADVACLSGETRCEYADAPRVGLCVTNGELATSKTHCGECFRTCRGDGACEDGACVDEPPAGRCLLSRGNADCAASEVCGDDGDGDDVGDCDDGDRGDGAAFHRCNSGEDCVSGLCAGDVCTTTCDFGCAFGMHCDDDQVAGGLCVVDDGEVCR